jgi:flavin-dependent dehydrogenase
MTGCHDVIVVGGGPAGSSCARELVRAGLDVVVADRAVFPRDKPCAGWITPEVTSAVGLDPDEYGRGRTLQPITGFDVGVLGGRRTVARFDRVISYAIRRCEFDAFLLQQSGARVCQGAAVAAIERVQDRWRVGGIGEARMLVGAGGHFCPVARLLNSLAPRHDARAGAGPSHARPEMRFDADEATIVAAQELEVRLAPRDACPVSGDLPELYFCRDLRGYGWCVRKGEYLNVGFGRLDQRGVRSAVRAFLAEMRCLGRVPDTFPSNWIGHAYRVYAWADRRLCGDAVLLAGDAAGLAYPASGEGILPAIVSGQLAARAILAAAPRFTRERLASYEQRLRGRFGAPDAETPLLSHVPPAAIQWAGRRLMQTPWFVRHVVVPRFLHVPSRALPVAA